MAKIYSKENTHLLKPKSETIRFLLNYSKSLKISVYEGVKFETTLN